MKSTGIAYFDCFSGISGDMVLGALVDAGLELGALERELRKLKLPGWSIAAEKVRRGAIAATQVKVEVESNGGGDETHQHSGGSEKRRRDAGATKHEHGGHVHHHDEAEEKRHHHHHHDHRGLSEIVKMIEDR